MEKVSGSLKTPDIGIPSEECFKFGPETLQRKSRDFWWMIRAAEACRNSAKSSNRWTTTCVTSYFRCNWPLATQAGATSGHRIEPIPDVLSHDQIDATCFIFERDKGNSLGRGRSLPQNHQPADPDRLAVSFLRQRLGGNDVAHCQLVAIKRNRVGCQGQSRRCIVGQYSFQRILFRQRHDRLIVRGQVGP